MAERYRFYEGAPAPKRGGPRLGGRTFLDNLLAEGKIEPMIVVMPNGQAVPRSSPWNVLRGQNTPLFEMAMYMMGLGLVPLSTLPAGAMTDRKGSLPGSTASLVLPDLPARVYRVNKK